MSYPTNVYYSCAPEDRDPTSPERYPENHVHFSSLLKPVDWLDRASRALHLHGLSVREAMVEEFDKAEPFDRVLGTLEELFLLRTVVDSFGEGVDNNPFLSGEGKFMIKARMTDFLKRRREFLQFYHRNRTFIETNGHFHAPLIITGEPRSGTTLLQRLVSEDPNTRSPYSFELTIPLPPMRRGVDPLLDPRIKSMNAKMRKIEHMAPGFLEKYAESQLYEATEKEESLLYMLWHNGINVINSIAAGESYLEQYLTYEDKRPVFRYEKIFFNTLDAYRPARSHWTLKAPSYAPYFPLIFEQYPGARVVVTHRNPLVTLPSCARMLESWNIAFVRDGCFDRHKHARGVQYALDKFIMVPFEYRKRHPEKEGQIHDCLYADLFDYPIETVREIYDKFGLEYTDEFEWRMLKYLENNYQGRFGRHRYSLQEYGIDAVEYYEHCREYMERYGFGIPDEMTRPNTLTPGTGLG